MVSMATVRAGKKTKRKEIKNWIIYFNIHPLYIYSPSDRIPAGTA